MLRIGWSDIGIFFYFCWFDSNGELRDPLHRRGLRRKKTRFISPGCHDIWHNLLVFSSHQGTQMWGPSLCRFFSACSISPCAAALLVQQGVSAACLGITLWQKGRGGREVPEDCLIIPLAGFTPCLLSHTAPPLSHTHTHRAKLFAASSQQVGWLTAAFFLLPLFFPPSLRAEEETVQGPVWLSAAERGRAGAEDRRHRRHHRRGIYIFFCMRASTWWAS